MPVEPSVAAKRAGRTAGPVSIPIDTNVGTIYHPPHAEDVRGPDRWPYIDMRGVERQLSGGKRWLLEEGLVAVHTPGRATIHFFDTYKCPTRPLKSRLG